MIPLAFYPLLFLTGLVAGFVDAIAGGGGLITVPVLLSFGLPPADALHWKRREKRTCSGFSTLR